MTFPLKPLLLGAALALGFAAPLPLTAHPHDGPGHGQMHPGPVARARFARALRKHPELAVAIDLRRLEMLYRKQGDETAIVAMYQDLLKRTEQPKLREFAERRLRQADRIAHPDQTIAELRARIDKKLAELR
ncbi:MAG: hypothetical protein KA505_09150 [Xanthomonadales bacterium]|nr:hypothetical protein [Xanthomonadales bacterium]MBP6078963.1 hypothetical protein [Xanthomonadales bacterium]MBP7622935.1 hypothetical protein [Xanthomonadales bacterium]